MCVGGRGAYKGFTRRATSTRLAPLTRQHSMAAFVSSSESIQKRSTDRHSFLLQGVHTESYVDAFGSSDPSA